MGRANLQGQTRTLGFMGKLIGTVITSDPEKPCLLCLSVVRNENLLHS
jgi:hypothetical protein